jgi:serine/threonine protein kinase
MPESHANALPRGTVLLEYRIESVLGADGFGVTYLAHDTVLQRNVAVKEYFPADLAQRGPDGVVAPLGAGTEANYRKGLAQFLVEARALAKFSHPSIVPVDRSFEANGTAYMIREYEKGESVAQQLAREPQPDEAALKAMLAPLLDGLEAVHRTGVLHRDIKPSNIFIRDDGPPVLLDFGTARLASRDAIQDIETVLTPGYAPVEQYLRSGRQGPWSDIYSLAGVLFLAVTGEQPPDALSRLRIDGVQRMLNATRARYSAPFLAAIQWGLALEEHNRPQSVDAWRGALFRAEPAPAAREADPGARPDATRKYVWMALGVVIFFLFVAGADIVKQRGEQARAVAGAAPRPAEPDVPAPPDAVGGGLSQEELARGMPHLADQFSAIDGDGSGYVTTAELQAYWRRGGAAAAKP